MSPLFDLPRLPVIDMSLFDLGDPWRDQVAAQLDAAAAEFGVFSIVGHGIDAAVIESLSALGPRASLEDNDAALDYTRMLSGLSHKLMAAIGRGLHLGDSFFIDRYTGNATTSLEVLKYPASSPRERTDSGLLSVRHQDEAGGLQVSYQGGWVDVPQVPGALIVSVGDKLAQLSSGRYIAASHRVTHPAGQARTVIPFSFDLSLGTVLEPIPSLRRAHVPAAELPVREASSL